MPEKIYSTLELKDILLPIIRKYNAQKAYIFGLDPTGIADSLIVYALVFGGYVCFAIICLPLNRFRFILVVGVLFLIVLSLSFANFEILKKPMFEFAPILLKDWQAILFILALVFVDIPLFYGADLVAKKFGVKSR